MSNRLYSQSVFRFDVRVDGARKPWSASRVPGSARS
jgi:hypothetical protein